MLTSEVFECAYKCYSPVYFVFPKLQIIPSKISLESLTSKLYSFTCCYFIIKNFTTVIIVKFHLI